MAASNFPRIAGQASLYLARQLSAYANGNRNNPVMTPIAKGLTPQQIEAVSAYYASLAAPSPKPPSKAAAGVPKRGQLLAEIGDEKIGVQGCANCHGPGGIGEPPSYPYLAGQHPGYLVTTFGEWKSGARKTDPSQQMPMIAKRLSDEDVKAVSAYYAAQPAPPPATQRANIAAGTTARPAAPAPQTSGQSSVPTQGVGVEQGAATSGGEQGPGGGGGASGSGPSGSPSGEAR
jgi:cytochrome c553